MFALFCTTNSIFRFISKYFKQGLGKNRIEHWNVSQKWFPNDREGFQTAEIFLLIVISFINNLDANRDIFLCLKAN